MDIIEKETVKEVPVEYWQRHYDGCRWESKSAPFASRGVAGAGLGLGIAGTALGLLALSKNGFNLFGNGSSTPENVNINTLGGTSIAPSTFDVWAKESNDIFNAQKALYDYALLSQSERFNDRQTLNSELFGIYKSQVDAGFGLYKSQRDANDITNARLTNEIFSLYKSTRDEDDSIRKELCDLKAQVAISNAVRPYQDKLIQCEIDKAFTAGITYTNQKTCNALYGQVVLPNTPAVTGYAGANQCGCPTVIAAAAGA